jgi:hypothetical protein
LVTEYRAGLLLKMQAENDSQWLPTNDIGPPIYLDMVRAGEPAVVRKDSFSEVACSGTAFAGVHEIVRNATLKIDAPPPPPPPSEAEAAAPAAASADSPAAAAAAAAAAVKDGSSTPTVTVLVLEWSCHLFGPVTLLNTVGELQRLHQARPEVALGRFDQWGFMLSVLPCQEPAISTLNSTSGSVAGGGGGGRELAVTVRSYKKGIPCINVDSGAVLRIKDSPVGEPTPALRNEFLATYDAGMIRSYVSAMSEVGEKVGVAKGKAKEGGLPLLLREKDVLSCNSGLLCLLAASQGANVTLFDNSMHSQVSDAVRWTLQQSLQEMMPQEEVKFTSASTLRRLPDTRFAAVLIDDRLVNELSTGVAPYFAGVLKRCVDANPAVHVLPRLVSRSVKVLDVDFERACETWTSVPPTISKGIAAFVPRVNVKKRKATEMASTSAANFMLFCYSPAVRGHASFPTEVRGLIGGAGGSSLPDLTFKIDTQPLEHTGVCVMESEFKLAADSGYGSVYCPGMEPVTAYCRNARLGGVIADVSDRAKECQVAEQPASSTAADTLGLPLAITTKKRKILLQ